MESLQPFPDCGKQSYIKKLPENTADCSAKQSWWLSFVSISMELTCILGFYPAGKQRVIVQMEWLRKKSELRRNEFLQKETRIVRYFERTDCVHFLPKDRLKCNGKRSSIRTLQEEKISFHDALKRCLVFDFVIFQNQTKIDALSCKHTCSLDAAALDPLNHLRNHNDCSSLLFAIGTQFFHCF